VTTGPFGKSVLPAEKHCRRGRSNARWDHLPTTHIAPYHDISPLQKARKCECRPEAATWSLRRARSRRSWCDFLFIMSRASMSIACPAGFIACLRSSRSTGSLAYMESGRKYRLVPFFLSSRSYNTNEIQLMPIQGANAQNNRSRRTSQPERHKWATSFKVAPPV
jgi:hypothetical protein